MSSAPSWAENNTNNYSTNATSNTMDNQPSWLSDDVRGSGGTFNSNTGDLQMTALQVDGVPESTITPAGEGGTNGSSNNNNPTSGSGSTSNMQAARQKTWGDFWRASFSRDSRTLLITLLVIVVMNIPYVQWALYPFTIFSTWIHELCHGLAAEMVGGNIIKLEIFPDTSGLCTYNLPSGSKRSAFVTSAGYQGTAVIGMLLLMLRRTKRGPRAGAMAIALMMVISVAIWVRNAFGIAFILGMGVVLTLAAWKLPSWWIRNLYVILGVTCALNAITSIKALFGSNQTVNGDEDFPSDAEAMSEIQGGSRTMWALIWFFLAIVLAFCGFIFAIPGPDEVADFTLCGMCQDMGCFYICNAQGRRLWTTLRGKKDKEGGGGGGGDAGNDVV